MGLGISQDDLARHWRDSVFPSLIRFCKQELSGLTEYCERRQANKLPTLSDNKILVIKQLSAASSFEEVERLYAGIENVFVADTLARIMQISYHAMHEPGILSELALQKLRGDILEVMARTYADIIEVMREQAEKGIGVGLNQVQTTKAAIDKVRKLIR